MAKEIDHALDHPQSTINENCRVSQSAQFLNPDHRLVVATLKLQLKSGRMVSSQPRLDVGKLKDERVAEVFDNMLSGDLEGLGVLGNPEELWSAFKTTFLDVAGVCLGTHHREKKNIVSQRTLDTVDQSRRARFYGRAELFRELRRKTVCAPRVDKEAYVQGICEGVEHHLWSSYSRPALRGICALHSSKPSLGVLQLERRVEGS